MFTEIKPEAFNPDFNVAISYIEYEDNFLFLKRHAKKPDGGLWCIPGGKLEIGETELDAVVRETYEETGLEIPNQKFRFYTKIYAQTSGKKMVDYIFFTELDRMNDIKINDEEHCDYKFSSLRDSLSLDLMPADNWFIRRFLNHRR